MKVICDTATSVCFPLCKHAKKHDPEYCPSLRCNCNEADDFCTTAMADVICVAAGEGDE